MKVETIDMLKIRQTVPETGKVILTQYNGSSRTGHPCIEFFIPGKGFSDTEFEGSKSKQRDILGNAFLEFYTEESGRRWFAYLKRIPIEFINTTDDDLISFHSGNPEAVKAIKSALSK